MPCAFGRSRMVTWPSWPIAPFPHSGLSFQTVRNKSVMVCAMIETFSKFILRKRKKETGMEPYTVTIVGTGKSIDFYIFVKVGYYPLLPLACACIFILLLCIVFDHTLSLSFELFKSTWTLFKFKKNYLFFLYDIKVTNVQWYDLLCHGMA